MMYKNHDIFPPQVACLAPYGFIKAIQQSGSCQVPLEFFMSYNQSVLTLTIPYDHLVTSSNQEN